MPVWQCTRKGYEVACQADPTVVTKYLAHPSPGTLEHTLTLVDFAIGWTHGDLWLPEDFPGPVRVVTEREILAVDQAPPKTPERYRGRATESQYKLLAGMTEREARDLAAEPVYGYSAYPGAGTRFPDALIMPAGVEHFTKWSAKGGPVGAIAVEFERTCKPDYRERLRAYQSTIERTRRAGAESDADTAKYRGVLYISPERAILEKVWAAAVEIGAGHLVMLMIAPQPLFATWPTRMSPLREGGPRT